MAGSTEFQDGAFYKAIQSQVVYIQMPAGTTAEEVEDRAMQELKGRWTYSASGAWEEETACWITYEGESVSSDQMGLTPQWTVARPSYREHYPLTFGIRQYLVEHYAAIGSPGFTAYTIGLAQKAFRVDLRSGVHSVIFDQELLRLWNATLTQGRWNTFFDWHLVPLKRPVIQSAEMAPSREYFQTPYKNYEYDPVMDFMKTGTKEELPTKRTGTFEFKFTDEYINSPSYDYMTIRNSIDSVLHGKILSITLEDEMDRNYVGVVKTEWSEEQTPKLTVKVECEPYKYDRMETFMISTTSAYVIHSGRFMSPATVRVYPSADCEIFTITGLARNPLTLEPEDIVLTNLRAGEMIVLHGERKTVTGMAGENLFSQVEMWEFPSLAAGSNYITLSSSAATIIVNSRPRF